MAVSLSKKEGVIYSIPFFTDHDIYLFKEGGHFNLFDKLGSHLLSVDGTEGTYFAVWAPNAEKVSVIGDFNRWNKESHPLKVREDGSAIWGGFIPGVSNGAAYKYYIVSRYNSYRVEKAIPMPFDGSLLPKRLRWCGT